MVRESAVYGCVVGGMSGGIRNMELLDLRKKSMSDE